MIKVFFALFCRLTLCGFPSARWKNWAYRSSTSFPERPERALSLMRSSEGI